jgi:HEAT repeat protein
MDVTLLTLTWIIAVLTLSVVLFVSTLVFQRARQISQNRRLRRVGHRFQHLIDQVVDGRSSPTSLPFEVAAQSDTWIGVEQVLRKALKHATPQEAARLIAFANHAGYSTYYQRQLTRGDHWQRALAAGRLADYRCQDAVGNLLSATRDAHQDVRSASIRALGRLGDGAAIGVLVAILEPVVQGDSDLSQRVVAGSLARYGTEAGEEVATLLSHDHWRVRGAALYVLGEIGGTAHVQAIIACLGDPEPDVRAKAAKALYGARASSALFPLLACLDDDAWLVRMHAIRAVAVLADDTAIGALSRCLEDRHWRVRQEAARALAGMGAEALMALTQCLLTGGDEYAAQQVVEELQRTTIIQDAIDRLARHPKESALDGPEAALLKAVAEVGAVSLILSAVLGHRNPTVRGLLVQLVAELPNPRVSPCLARVATDDIDPLVRRDAADCLKRRRPSSEVA